MCMLKLRRDFKNTGSISRLISQCSEKCTAILEYWQVNASYLSESLSTCRIEEGAFEAASLLIILRLWRLVRILNGRCCLSLSCLYVTHQCIVRLGFICLQGVIQKGG